MNCKDAIEIFLAGVEAAKPYRVIPNFFKKNITIHERINNIQFTKSKLFVFSLGKAGYTMAKEFSELYPVDSAFVYTKKDHLPKDLATNSNRSFVYREGSHPIPSTENVKITSEILAWLKTISIGDTLVVLLSGGGSALLEMPIEPYTIKDIIDANEKFMKSPLTISEINQQRKKLSRVKGGGLLTFLSKQVSVITLALSDVISDDPQIIASAPSYPGSDYYVIGNLKNSISAAKEKAEALGYFPLIFSDHWDLDAKETGKILSENVQSGIWKNWTDSHQKVAILIGGEMVANVKEGGLGGRNQEAVLSFAVHADKNKIRNFCFLSAGTDGTDGPTPVAGACVDAESFLKMKQMQFDPAKELDHSNSYPVLKAIRAHVDTGPTGTNVNDLLVLLLETKTKL